MDAFIREHIVLVQNVVLISGIVVCFILICGGIRFGIAISRRRRGIYPPSPDDMDD